MSGDGVQARSGGPLEAQGGREAFEKGLVQLAASLGVPPAG